MCRSSVENGEFVAAWAGIPNFAEGSIRSVGAFGDAAEYVTELRLTLDPALPTSLGPTGRCVAERATFYVDDFLNDPCTVPWHERAKHYGIASSVAVPVMVKGEVRAVLTLYSAEKDYFAPELRALLEEVSHNVSLAWQAVLAEQQRVAADVARMQSQERFERLLQHSPIPMQVVSCNTGQIKSVNEAYIRVFGYTPEDARDMMELNRLCFRGIEDRESRKAQWQISLAQAINGGPSKVVTSEEMEIVDKSGQVHLVRGFMTAVGEDALIQWEDLTDIRKAQDALRLNEQRFRNMVEQGITGMLVLQNRKIVYMNPRFREVTGWTDDDLGRDPADLITDQQLKQLVVDGRKRLEEGAPDMHLRAPFTTRHGQELEVDLFGSFCSWDGHDAFLLFGQDVTEARRAQEAELAQARLFRNLIEQNVVGVHVTVDGNLVYANPKVREAADWTDLDIGKPVSDRYSETSTSLRVRNAEAKLADGAESVDLLIPVVNAKGEHIQLQLHAGRCRWKGQDANLVFSHDVTEKLRAEQRIADYVRQLEASVRGTLQALSTMLALRDPYTSGHERRVGAIAVDLARRMGLAEAECETLRWSALVHDIGKIALPAELLSKPGPLTEVELAMMKEHPERGYEILRDVPFPAPIAEIIRQHHERLDGSGYPRGLKGEQIRPEARILMVADVLEAMSAHRPYRPALQPPEVLAEIERRRDTWFDPIVVDTILKMVREERYKLPA